MDDHELLREYVERQSEKAFADLVARHINLVYSTALRVVQDPALAKDITQSVFINLARKAPAIRTGHALPGWLYRVTRYQATNVVRDDRLRREREMETITMQSTVTEADLQHGLVLHYTFDSAPVGAQAIDASKAGNNGQVVGPNWVSDPQRGGVLQFSPPNQYIRVPNNDSLNSSNLTLSAWIKTSNQGDTWRRVFDKSWTNGFALSIGGGHTSNNKFVGKAVIEIDQTHAAYSDESVTDGQWHHVAVTYDGTIINLYVDGVRQKHYKRWNGQVPTNSFDLTLGINLVDPNPQFNEVGSSFDGLMDEPMIFNRALSPAEIKFLFDSQKK